MAVNSAEKRKPEDRFRDRYVVIEDVHGNYTLARNDAEWNCNIPVSRVFFRRDAHRIAELMNGLGHTYDVLRQVLANATHATLCPAGGIVQPLGKCTCQIAVLERAIREMERADDYR